MKIRYAGSGRIIQMISVFVQIVHDTMALQECKLTTLLINEFFGPVIASVADELKWGPKPLKLLSLSVKLPLSTVKQALGILIHFNFVVYKLSETNVCEYYLVPENVLLITRYPKFILLTKNRFGREGEALIEELLRSGKMTCTNLILKVTCTLAQGSTEISFSLRSIRNSALELIDNGFIIPVEKVTREVVPIAIKLPEHGHILPIDIEKLTALYNGTDTEMPANEYYWKVNFDRFLVEIRDEIIINAMSRRFDIHAGVVIRHILKLAHQKSNFWWNKSNAVSMMQIKESIGNNTNEAYALKFMDQYITVMKEDFSGIVGQSIDYAGGVIICMKEAIENLTSLYISQIIEQKFGFKAARVFRLIQDKKYCELEQIQQLAMLPDKEAKSIAYKLLEENFIQMQELKKPSATSSSGQNKPFFLFYVDLNVVVRLVLSMCYKTVQNVIHRRKEEENKQIHIIEKKKQSDLYVEALREQSASEEQIKEMVDQILTHPEKVILDNVQRITKKLQSAELQIDETIFVLQMHVRYNKTVAPESKLKKRS